MLLKNSTKYFLILYYFTGWYDANHGQGPSEAISQEQTWGFEDQTKPKEPKELKDQYKGKTND